MGAAAWLARANAFCCKSYKLAMQQKVAPPCASPPSNNEKPPSKDWQREKKLNRFCVLMRLRWSQRDVARWLSM